MCKWFKVSCSLLEMNTALYRYDILTEGHAKKGRTILRDKQKEGPLLEELALGLWWYCDRLFRAVGIY